MTTFYEIDLASLPRKISNNVTTLPGAPPRTLDGRLISELSERDLMNEFMKRRIMRLPPLFADFERN